MTIFVTGGSGFIGSHTCVALINAGFNVVVVDNLSNSSVRVVDRIEAICGIRPIFVQGDIRDASCLDHIFASHSISAVIHFAGLKAVGESVKSPLEYYKNNVCGTIELLSAMGRGSINTLVFSSSATVYGDPETVPILENSPRSATNPYGRSKLIIEDILEDLYRTQTGWRIARLRYFNPVGSHESGLIGEDPQGIPNNLMPYISQVAVGRLEKLSIFGGDYPTPDGTGVRDYIHVMDLAEGHIAALNYLKREWGMHTVNLGAGKGVSVLELVQAFEEACKITIPYQVVERRPGDIAQCWADVSLANASLGWQTKRDLKQMCASAWRWQLQNPNGYQ